MKTHFFKRGIAGMLSLVMCLSAFIGLGTTTAFAAGEQAEVYLISFPRSGDANLDYSGTWGHSNLHYMNGWYSGESKYTTIRAMHSYDGTETDDGHGNIVETESTVTQTYLYITVSHKTADEMAAQYGFNEEQKEYLAELLADENNSLWSQVLYGITGTDDQIVTVALSQIGTMGGDPYWSWYGFNSRVEWCACFVSWCANECGYIDAGVIPKYAGCVNGVQWFKDRGQWLDNSAEPTPGMIIFFDWADESGQDGLSDHTGIVQKVENGRVYTVEGNSGDSVRQNSYPVGYYEILGYGAPAY